MALNLQKAEFIRSATGPKDFPRDSLRQIAFAGRSNVGKSSVINRLLNRKNFARVGTAPGKTTHINYFRIDEKLYLVDLPGYGYAKVSRQEKERWAKLIQSWFDDRTLMTLGILIVDARHKPTVDDKVMSDYFKSTGRPFAVVANKLDKLKKSEIDPNLALIRETLELGECVKVIPFSAEKGDGREELLRLILDHLGTPVQREASEEEKGTKENES
ncbi:MAG: ribosome biogenesis GTP-binding protein YihA/YsxC [Oscillospiraceae bacterium]|nr:ribosome biogenesis GTP-binding protein YihA/YsxC [Oscillospiraceae bacterium]